MMDSQTIAKAVRDAIGAVMREQWSGPRSQMGALALLIDAADGLHTITSGEVSVRPACGPDTIPSPAL